MSIFSLGLNARILIDKTLKVNEEKVLSVIIATPLVGLLRPSRSLNLVYIFIENTFDLYIMNI